MTTAYQENRISPDARAELSADLVDKIGKKLDEEEAWILKIYGYKFLSGGYCNSSIDDWNDESVFVTFKHGVMGESTVHEESLRLDINTLEWEV